MAHGPLVREFCRKLSSNTHHICSSELCGFDASQNADRMANSEDPDHQTASGAV